MNSQWAMSELGSWSVLVSASPEMESRVDNMKISESHLIFLDLQQSQDGPDLCLFEWLDGDASLMAR